MASAGKGTVYLYVPEPNTAAINIAKDYGMNPIFETARMYTRKIPKLPLGTIFGITNYELG